MTRKTRQPATAIERGPGAFLSDGRFREDALLGERGHIDRLLRTLVKERANRLSPGKASDVIVAANAVLAFPNSDQWARAGAWAACWCATSAEAAVVYEGCGAAGHWCGERHLPGSERDCHDARHRTFLSQEQVGALVADVVASIGKVPSVTVWQDEDEPQVEPYRLTDEQVASAREQARLLREETCDGGA